MDTFLQDEKKDKGSNKTLLLAILAAILIVAAGIGLYISIPKHEEQKQQHLEGAFLEGTPEFEALTKKIAIQNDDNNTIQSPTGLGTITMFTRSKVRNMSDKTLTALEVRVSILDQMGKVIKDKKMLVVPTDKIKDFPPNSDIFIEIPVEGFSKDDDRARVQWKVTAIKVQR